jgi:asparagine synthase (glutamine-hydrolysing)
VEDIVPGDIVWRKDKVGFETPEVAWLRQWMSAEPSLFQRGSPCGAYLDLDTVRTTIASWTKNDDDAPRPPVWRWINLELWLDCFRQTTVMSER